MNESLVELWSEHMDACVDQMVRHVWMNCVDDAEFVDATDRLLGTRAEHFRSRFRKWKESDK